MSANFNETTDAHLKTNNGCFHNILRQRVIQSSSIEPRGYYKKPNCPWITHDLFKMIKIKDFWYRTMKQHRNNTYYIGQFRILRNMARALIRRRKKSATVI